MEKNIIVERPTVPVMMLPIASLSSIWLMPDKMLSNINYKVLLAAYSNYVSRVIEAENKGVL